VTESVAGPIPRLVSRRDELASNWNCLQERVAAAARAADRPAGGITVIAVTKTWPASDIADLRSLGVVDIGENRAQELTAKIADLGTDPELRWHFIGQLQRNKAALIGRQCTALHTLDRLALVAPLGHAAAEAGRRLDVFLQLSLDGDPKRGGLSEAAVGEVADAVAAAPALRLVGLMAVPPLGAASRPAFARLRAASEDLRRSYPDAQGLSAGMSADLEDAVMEGATHLRVGTGLMGSRA
jgi:pyridoxal phosphate enzyme (YggS family)